MRRFASALAVASLFGCSLALAQAPTSPGSQAPPAQPPPSASPSESTGAAQQPGASTGEHATTGKHMSKKACSKEAKAKQLKGDEKKQFMKDCEHGKTTE